MKHIIFLLFTILMLPILTKGQTKLLHININNGFKDLIKVDTCKIERDPIKLAEKYADDDAKQVLKTGRIMALKEKAILPGTCWTYINAVFNRAGFSKDRYFVYKSKKEGPYANTNLIQAGDWLYYINHSYKNIDHSGIFIHWIDKDQKIALILSYTGRYKRKPATYKTYKLDNVFFITRAGSKENTEDILSAQVDNSENKNDSKT